MGQLVTALALMGEADDASGPLNVPGHLVPVPTLGHSAGHHALYLPSADVMFTGDALMTLDPFKGTRRPVVFSEDPRRNDNPYTALANLEPYRQSALSPAHSDPDSSIGALGRALDAAQIA